MYSHFNCIRKGNRFGANLSHHSQIYSYKNHFSKVLFLNNSRYCIKYVIYIVIIKNSKCFILSIL